MKKLMAALMLMSFGAQAFDANTATRAELESVKGIGPKTAEKIEAARTEKPFTSCTDFQERVKGIGDKKREAWESEGHTCGSAN